MGIVKVTPDGFSDGGEFLAPEAAIEHVLQLSVRVTATSGSVEVNENYAKLVES